MRAIPILSLCSDYRTALDNPDTQFTGKFITEPINTSWHSDLNRKRNLKVKRDMKQFQKSRKGGGGSGPGQLQWFKNLHILIY